MLEQVRFAFIGGGNMAEALINGLIRAGTPANHITATTPSMTHAARTRNSITHEDTSSTMRKSLRGTSCPS